MQRLLPWQDEKTKVAAKVLPPSSDPAMEKNVPDVTEERPDAAPHGEAEAAPRLVAGVELLGELRGSGFAEPQWLARRGGRFLQLSEVLYRVASEVDGERT